MWNVPGTPFSNPYIGQRDGNGVASSPAGGTDEALADLANMMISSPTVSGIRRDPSLEIDRNIRTTSRVKSNSSGFLAQAIDPVPAAFPELDAKSLNDLEVLSSDQEAFDRFVSDLPYVHNLSRRKEELRLRTQQVANGGGGDHAKQLREQIESLKREIGDEETRIEEKTKKMDSYLERNGPAMLISRLQEALAESDQRSEKLRTDFLEKRVSLEEYIRERNLYHDLDIRAKQLESTFGALR